jgi:hypothetical protein
MLQTTQDLMLHRNAVHPSPLAHYMTWCCIQEPCIPRRVSTHPDGLQVDSLLLGRRLPIGRWRDAEMDLNPATPERCI